MTLVGVPREKFGRSEGIDAIFQSSTVATSVNGSLLWLPANSLSYFYHTADISPHSHDIESSATMALYGTIPGSPIYTTTQTPKTNGVMPIGCRLSCARTPRGARPRACLCASSKCHGHARRTHKEARVRGPC